MDVNFAWIFCQHSFHDLHSEPYKPSNGIFHVSKSKHSYEQDEAYISRNLSQTCLQNKLAEVLCLWLDNLRLANDFNPCPCRIRCTVDVCSPPWHKQKQTKISTAWVSTSDCFTFQNPWVVQTFKKNAPPFAPGRHAVL